jgi:ribosomal protein S28E/S33
LTTRVKCDIIITEDKERTIERRIKMFVDDFDIMITPEELGFDYSELLEEIEM